MTTVGVDLGGTKVQSLVLNADGEVTGAARMRTPPTGDRSAVVEVLVACVHDALAEAGVAIGDIEGVGVGSPGVVSGGTVAQAVNVPGWSERFSLSELLTHQLEPPVRVVNDVTALAVAEHRFGAGRGHRNLLVVSVGTGVGGGLIIDDEVFMGAFGAAGEFGHTIVERGGAVCPCGRRGCVEAYAGRRAMEFAARRAIDAGKVTSLFRITEEMGKQHPTSKVFKAALDQGDPVVAELLGWGAEALGKGIASAVNLLDVERVIVGGGLADRLGSSFITLVDAAARPALFVQPPRVEIVPAELRERGGAIGAALLARERQRQRAEHDGGPGAGGAAVRVAREENS